MAQSLPARIIAIDTTTSITTTSSMRGSFDTSIAMATNSPNTGIPLAGETTRTSTGTGVTSSAHSGQTKSPELQTPSHHSSPNSNGSSGMSAGETAGIAIGCAVIGAVIAGFIVFLTMRKSSRGSSKRGHPDDPVLMAARSDSSTGREWHEPEKKPSALVAPMASQHGVPPLEHLLPQPVDTKYLSNELSTLRSLIRNHLNNFFHTQPIERQLLASSIEPSALAEIANDTPFNPGEWIDLLASEQTRMNALRFIFAWVIFRRLEPECEPTKTLLPPGMTACYRHMSEFPAKKQVGGVLQSKWRVITGHLLREQYVTRAFGESDDRVANLQDTVRMLDAILRPLGIGELDTARKDNMNEVLKRAASIGFTLASQPSSWIFDWESPAQGQQATPLVVFPSLIQSANDEGQATADNLEIGEKELGNSIAIVQ